MSVQDYLPFSYSPVAVYRTSMFGRIDTLLGSFSPEFNTSADAGNTIDYTVCLPVGTYQLVFVASGVENAIVSKAAITQVLLTGSPCTYTSSAGASRQYRSFKSFPRMEYILTQVMFCWFSITPTFAKACIMILAIVISLCAELNIVNRYSGMV